MPDDLKQWLGTCSMLCSKQARDARAGSKCAALEQNMRNDTPGRLVEHLWATYGKMSLKHLVQARDEALGDFLSDFVLFVDFRGL